MLKKERFGKYELQYDTILDHDAYEYLRVTFEVPRGQTDEAYVLLNGYEVGKVKTVSDGKKIIGYLALRVVRRTEACTQFDPINNGEPYKHIGKAAAAIISDFVK